jgi:hypothetical protein
VADAVEHLLGQPIEPRERRRRLHPVERESPERVPKLRHGRRRMDALADDVPDHEPEAPVAQRDRVEPVAPDVELGRPWQVTRGELHALHPREGRRENAALECRGDRLLRLEVAGTLERLRSLSGERRHEPALVHGQGPGLRPRGRQQPDDPALGDEQDERSDSCRRRPRRRREALL